MAGLGRYLRSLAQDCSEICWFGLSDICSDTIPPLRLAPDFLQGELLPVVGGGEQFFAPVSYASLSLATSDHRNQAGGGGASPLLVSFWDTCGRHATHVHPTRSGHTMQNKSGGGILAAVVSLVCGPSCPDAGFPWFLPAFPPWSSWLASTLGTPDNP